MHVYKGFFLITLGTGTFLGCREASAPAPAIELRPGHDTVSTHDSDVTGAAWLGGARWGILAAPNETAGIIDFSRKSIVRLGVGRQEEIRNPSTLFVAQGSLYIGDWSRRRTTQWTGEGKLVRSYATSDVVRGSLPQARDEQGRFKESDDVRKTARMNHRRFTRRRPPSRGCFWCCPYSLET